MIWKVGYFRKDQQFVAVILDKLLIVVKAVTVEKNIGTILIWTLKIYIFFITNQLQIMAPDCLVMINDQISSASIANSTHRIHI